jgi:hypothetical protein
MGYRLRIDYLGTSMDLPAKAFAVEHQARGHEVTHRERLCDIPTTPPPDVVVHAPLDKTPHGLVSTCALAGHVPKTTLLLMLFDNVGPAHAMLACHAQRGHCHPRILIHRLDSARWRSPAELIERIEAAATGPDRVTLTGPLPPGLSADVDQDLGEVMETKERFAALLYTAAVQRDWGNWPELAALVNVAPGVVKNTNSELGQVLKEARLVPWDTKWTSHQFSRFVAEHCSFIIAFGMGHLGFDPPARPFWLRH